MAKREYNNKLPSVTTIISQLASYGLMEWFKRTNYADIIREGNRAKEIGTDLHSAIQSYIETGEAKTDTAYPDEVTIALQSFAMFRKDHQHIKLMRSEKELTSLKYGFNGTIDCLADTIVIDWKSSKCGDKEKPSIWDEAKIQTSAYVHLINEVEGTSYEKALIVSIAKDKVAYNTYELGKSEIEGYFNNIFLPLLQIYNYKKQIKKESKNEQLG